MAINKLSHAQNDWQFEHNLSRCISLNINDWILIEIFTEKYGWKLK